MTTHKLALKYFLDNVRNSPKAQKALQAAAEDETCRNFSTAWKLLADYDDEKPAEKHEMSGKLEVGVVFTRETRKRTSS